MTQREGLLAALIACRPCYGDEQMKSWAEHWPEDVTLSWLMRNRHRGGDVIKPQDSLWMGVAMVGQRNPGLAKRALLALAEETSRITWPDGRAPSNALAKAIRFAKSGRYARVIPWLVRHGASYEDLCERFAAEVEAFRP